MAVEREEAELRAAASGRSLLTQISSVLALAISVFALATSAYQTRIMQSQARASVWPFLSVGYSFFDSGAETGFRLKVSNHGVGPALIKSVRMSIDGQPVLDWDDYLKRVLGRSVANMTQVTYGSFSAVLPPDANRETTLIPIELSNAKDAAIAAKAADRLKIDICYCSVYDDCWIKHWMIKDAEPIAHCLIDPRTEFHD